MSKPSKSKEKSKEKKVERFDSAVSYFEGDSVQSDHYDPHKIEITKQLVYQNMKDSKNSDIDELVDLLDQYEGEIADNIEKLEGNDESKQQALPPKHPGSKEKQSIKKQTQVKTFNYQQNGHDEKQFNELKTKMTQVLQIARQFQREIQQQQKTNAKLKSKLDLKQLELGKQALLKNVDNKNPDEKAEEFDQMFKILENQNYELEAELKQKNLKIKEQRDEITEVKARNARLQEQINKKTRQLEDILMDDKKKKEAPASILKPSTQQMLQQKSQSTPQKKGSEKKQQENGGELGKLKDQDFQTFSQINNLQNIIKNMKEKINEQQTVIEEQSQHSTIQKSQMNEIQKEKQDLEKYNHEANARLQIMSSVIESQKDTDGNIMSAPTQQLNFDVEQLDLKYKKNSLQNIEKQIEKGQFQANNQDRYQVIMSPTSSRQGSEKLFNHKKGDIINRPNGTITSKKDHVIDTPDANYKIKNSLSPKNKDSPVIDYDLYNHNDDGIIGIKTEEALIDTKRSQNDPLINGKIDKVHQTQKSDQKIKENLVESNGITHKDIELKELKDDPVEKGPKKYWYIVVTFIILILIASIVTTIVIYENKVDQLHQEQIDQMEASEQFCLKEKQNLKEDLNKEKQKEHSLAIEDLKNQHTIAILQKEQTIQSGFSEQESYRLLTEPINCMKFEDKCTIDYDAYCKTNIIPESYCDTKVANNYNDFCTRQVNCKYEPQKCLIDDQHCRDRINTNYQAFCNQPIDCKLSPDQCQIHEQYCFDKVDAKYDDYCKKPVDCYLHPDKCLNKDQDDQNCFEQVQAKYDDYCKKQIDCKLQPDKCLIPEQYCSDKVDAKYDDYCKKQVDCKLQPDKCLIQEQYCTDKVDAKYDDYCKKQVDCKLQPDKCLIQEQYCNDKVQAKYDDFCSKPVDCSLQPDKCQIQEQYCTDKVEAKYDDYCKKQVDCKLQPDKCQIQDQYCTDKVEAKYDDYCNKPVDCSQQPDKCQIQEQYCTDKVEAKYDDFCSKPVDCKLQPAKCLNQQGENKCEGNKAFNKETKQCVECEAYQIVSNNVCVNVCPGHQIYNLEKQLCNDKPLPVVQPEDCVDPEYYIKDGPKCEECPTTLFKGYNKAEQSCEPCRNGQQYDATQFQCVDPPQEEPEPVPEPFVPLDPTECKAPFYYIKATEQCEACKLTQTSGYLKDSQSCEACPWGLFYDAGTQSCFACQGESRFIQDAQCLFCPEFQINNGNNKCEYRCSKEERWTGRECKAKDKYLNLCRYSGLHVSKALPSENGFEDQCDHPCHKVEIHMHLTAKKDENPYFPVSIKCIGDDESESRSHGEKTDLSNIGYVGGKTACIYRVERQGSSQSISAIRYYWYHGDEYHVDTFGDYLYGASSDVESFNGCMHGFWGNYKTDESNEIDLGFRFSYPNPYQCATDDRKSGNICQCDGSVHYGPLYGHDPARGDLTFLQMKNWYPGYKTISGQEQPLNQVVCDASTFSLTKENPDEIFQCQCEEEQ